MGFCFMLSLMNAFLDVPEMVITDAFHNFRNIASQNYLMGEQNQNPIFLFSSAHFNQEGICSALQAFVTQTRTPHTFA